MIRKVERVRTELIMDFIGLETELDPSVDLLETNAFYDSADNSLTGTGNTLSHEIGHGFDMIGRTSDENGVDKDWWAKEDLAEYDKRAKCLVNQYNSYDDPDFGMKLNGSTTIDEIIADGLGVETSWRAFKKLDLSKEQHIVGFDNYSIAKVYFRIAALGSKEALVSPDESTRSTSGVTSSRPTVSTFENPKKTPNSSKVPSATTEKAETKTEPVISETTVRPNIPTLKPRNVCETPECITLAHQLLNWHDPSIDPCVDFYKSACGKYNEHTTVYGTRSQKKNLIVASLIDEYLIKNTTYKTKTENNFKFYYNKCVELQKNTEAFQSNSEQALKDIFDDIKTIGSWPLLDKNWDKSKFNLNDMLFKIASFGKMEFGLFEIAISDSLIISPVGERIEPDESLKKTIKEILKENGIKVSDKTLNKDFDEYASFIQTLDQVC
ncbi:hypothetical protein GCK72_006924 [Caenorhabditis remanei]|uniref:Peptidase M13 C-terminal domain-containing protein n=1 Tax=Caenorhabditis remanei TaxID=31234 RepID=A0A6A5HJV5_CAERE|nr:hypothetical protein GCK72_006924 [Caenorhabditis remanei]KAF1766966.1 hypothetical protein GCK72_006924 [Caenorhabditis remanei]